MTGHPMSRPGRRTRAGLVAAWLGTLWARTAAGGVDVEVRLEPAEVLLGSPARLEVRIRGPEDLEVDLSPLLDRLASLDGARPLARAGGGEAGPGRVAAGVELRSFRVSAPAGAPTTVAVAWRAGGQSGVLPVWLPLPRVREVARRADEAEGSLRDPAGPVEVLEGAGPWLVGGFLAAGLLGALGLALRRRPGQAPAPVPAAPPEPPWELARRLLDELEARGDGGDPRAFHYRLSEIVRGCMVGRFGLAGLAETSDELLAECARAGVPEPIRKSAERVFRSLDLVKFGPDAAGPGASTGSLAACRALVAGMAPAAGGGG